MTKFRNKIILASASPRRRELLEKCGFNFEVRPSFINEETQTNSDTFELALRNAMAKAQDIAQRFPGDIVLGSDTIVVYGGKVYGKPKDVNDAKTMLSILQGKTHSVYTAVAIVKKSAGIAKESFDESRVTFRKMDVNDIEDYLSKVHVLDKAGSYAAQEFGELIIEKIEGAFDNVMGLPCELLKKELDSLFPDATL